MGIVVGFPNRKAPEADLSQRVLPHNVLPGFRYFIAYPPAPDVLKGFVSEILVRGMPKVAYTSGGPTLMGKYLSVRNGAVQKFESDFSLRDCGIIQNTYNMNCTFFTREDADAYLRRVEAKQFTHFEQRKWDKLNARRSFTIRKGKK